MIVSRRSSIVTLEELEAAAKVCTACRLSEKRRNVAFADGDPFSPLVLIGEGPGDQEDREGKPFVGKAGQLLNKALIDAGLSREQVYICNIVKCRAADWSTGKPVNRPPQDDEAQACRRWLVPQLALVKPKVILCIGSPSARNIIKKDFKITAERGRYYPSEFAKTAIATLHPAYILRQQGPTTDGGYSLLVADIKKAWDAAQRLLAGKSMVGEPQPEPEKVPSNLFD